MFFPSSRATAKPSTRQVQRRIPRPILEGLEDRTLLDAIRWINPAGGDWSVPSNWDLRRLPRSGDDVLIQVPNITINHSRDNDIIRSLMSQARVVVSNSILEFRGGDSDVRDYLKIDLRGALIVSNASLSGSGSLDCGPMENVSLNFATINVSYNAQGTTTAQGQNRLNGAVTTGANSVFRVQGSNAFGHAQLTVANGFTNYGAVELTAVDGPWDATLNVQSGALINAARATIRALQGTGGGRRAVVEELENSGEFRASLVSTFYVRFLHRAVNDGTMIVDRGSLALDTPSFTQNGSLMSSDGTSTTLMVGECTNYRNGTLTRGTYDIAGTVQMNIGPITTNAANITFRGPNARFIDQLYHDLLERVADNEGQLTWTNGSNFTSASSLTNNGSLTVSLTSRVNVFAVWVSVGFFEVGDGGVVKLGADCRISGRIRNAGRLEVAPGQTLLVNDPYLQPGGTTALGTGATLILAAGGSSSGTFELANNSVVKFRDGTFDINAGSFSGEGSAQIQGGRAVVHVPFQWPKLQMDGGELRSESDWIRIPSFHWTSGRIGGSGYFVMPVGDECIVDGLGEKVVDRVYFYVERTCRVSGGPVTMLGAGSIRVLAGAQLSLGDTQIRGGSLVVQDAGTVSGSGAVTVASMTINPGGNLVVDYNARFTCIPEMVVFRPARVALRPGATLTLAGGGSSSGAFDLADGSLLQFTGGSFSLDEGATFQGAGLAQIAGASLVFNTSVAMRSASLVEGEAVVPRGTEWIIVDSWSFGAAQSGSRLRGGGRVKLLSGSRSTIQGPGTKVLDDFRIDLSGILTAIDSTITALNGGGVDTRPLSSFFAYNATFQGGVYVAGGDVNTDGNVIIDGSVTNAGGNVTVRTGQLAVTNYLQTGGTTFVHADRALVSPMELRIVEGLLGGSGLVDASVVNGGTIRPGSSSNIGDLHITRLVNTPSATLVFRCAGADSYDRLLIGGPASLDGTLALRLNDYQPAPGDRLDLLTADSIDGTFAASDLDSPGPGQRWEPEFAIDHISLTAVPDPSAPARGSHLESRAAISPARVFSVRGQPSEVVTLQPPLREVLFARHATRYIDSAFDRPQGEGSISLRPEDMNPI